MTDTDESASPPRVVIADDEAPARAWLRDLLKKDGRVEIVGEAQSGAQALDLCKRLLPDLVFLDIRMPDGSGMDVAHSLTRDSNRAPIIVFVTAYDRYAVEAFEVEATDYLVKPFNKVRLSATLDRVLALVATTDNNATQTPITEAPTTPAGDSIGAKEPLERKYLKRIGIESRGTIAIVLVEEIDYISSEGNYVELVVGDQRHLLREKLATLQTRLDPRHFCRIHRSSLVRLDRIKSVKRTRSGDCVVTLLSGTQLNASRTHRDDLSKALGIDL